MKNILRKETIAVFAALVMMISAVLVAIPVRVEANAGDPPVAVLKGPSQWPKGTTCHFDGSNSYDPDGTIVKYEWQFCGNCAWESTGSYPKATEVFSAAGTWKVSLKVTDSDGQTDTDSYTLTVSYNKLPVANAGGGAYKRYFGDVGSAVHFDGTGSYDPDGVFDQDGHWLGIVRYDWKWFKGDSWHNNIGGKPTHTYNQEGDYTVTLRVHDYYGGTDTDTATVHITNGNSNENQKPVAKITDSSGNEKYWWTSSTNTFYGDQSYDPDGGIITHWWTIYDGDGKHEFTDNSPPTSITYTHKYASPSSGWLVVLSVMDNDCEITHTTARVLCGGGTPDLKISKIDTPDPVNAGDILTYKIKVCNNDPTIDPKIVDNYDQNNLTIIDADGGVDNGDTIVWDHVVIPGQDCVSYTVTALVDDCVPNGTIIKNKAKVYYESTLVDSITIGTTVLNDKICGLTAEKKVKLIDCEQQGSWADEVDANVGDTVRFRLYFENNGDIPLYFTSIRDVLPAGLEYADNAVVNGVPKEPAVTDNLDGTTTLLWRFLPLYIGEDNELSVGETLTIEFDALVVDCGELVNKMYAPISNEVGREGYLHTVEVYDEATVNVECDEQPGISIEKFVAFDCSNDYQKSVDADVGDYVKFKIFVNNTGGLTLYNIEVTDTLPSGLTYIDGSAVPTPSDISGNVLTWTISQLDSGQGEVIRFSADVEDCGNFENVANATAVDEYQNEVADEDSAFVTVECPEEPCLEYTPNFYDFGCHAECEVDTTTFEIWNGCEGTLEYNISWDCGWIESVTPSDGGSTGEHDTITVQISTTGMHPREYTCDIYINSNGGNGIFTVNLTIGDCQDPDPDPDPDPNTDPDPDPDPSQDPANVPPSVVIKTPLEQKLYFRNRELFSLGRTLIIGPITIKANATDTDGSVEKVEFYIDDELKETMIAGPYEYNWNERAIGEYNIKVKVYDNEGAVTEQVRNVLIINLGRGS